jgi:hypothetical protein
MGKRYICEVKKDNINNELELVRANEYNTIKSSADEGAIRFVNSSEMHKYFHDHCISEDKLGGNNLFMFLFFILLLIFLITLICQIFNKSDIKSSGISNTAFGRFSF